MNIEPNMYVRTKEGKIFNCFASKSMGKPVYYIKDSLTNGFIDYNEAYKVSPNIIDIVQVGDYVNGCMVINKKDDTIQIIQLIIPFDLKEKDIKSIVTKEMFANAEYKVGE